MTGPRLTKEVHTDTYDGDDRRHTLFNREAVLLWGLTTAFSIFITSLIWSWNASSYAYEIKETSKKVEEHDIQIAEVNVIKERLTNVQREVASLQSGLKEESTAIRAETAKVQQGLNELNQSIGQLRGRQDLILDAVKDLGRNNRQM